MLFLVGKEGDFHFIISFTSILILYNALPDQGLRTFRSEPKCPGLQSDARQTIVRP